MSKQGGGDGGRRQFLRLLGLASLGLAGCSRTTGEDQRLAQNAEPAAAQPMPQSPEPTVVVVRCDAVVGDEGSIDAGAVQKMLDAGICALTGQEQAAAGWGGYFTGGDTVAIKANCLSGPPVATHPEVTDAIAAGLQAAGVAPEDILIYDRLTDELETSGFTVNKGRTGVKCFGTDEVGYDDTPTTVKRVGTCFSRIVSEWCQAIVNVPVLKDHDLAGLTGALKNHYGSVHNPNKLHGQPEDRCSPYIADLNCAELLRSRERLIVYDALMVCYEGGPGHKPATTVPFGGIMLATDPVAADTVGLRLLEELRAEHGLEPLAGSEREPTYLALAGDGDHQLGCNDLAKITVLERVIGA